MECAICKSTEFSFHDGVYFCKECNSQIKESRKEECEQEGFSRRSLLRSTAVKKSGKTERAATKEEYTSHWTTTEAYNIILHKQVCALIKLGASEKLKDVVLYIWSKYLQKCELAFRKDHNAAEELPRLSVFAKRRDIAVLYGKENLTRKKRKSSKKKLGKKRLSRKSIQEDSPLSEDVVDSEPESEALTGTEAKSSSSSDGATQHNTKKKLKFSTHALKLHRSFGKKKFRRLKTDAAELYLDNMTVCKSLCFCYLGLLYTEDQLLLSDIIRFVNEGKIPYIHVADCFPASMKMQGSDYFNFAKYSSPDSQQVSRLSWRLCGFLSLPKLKHPLLMPIVCRFIKDLNLPDEMIQIVKILKDKNEELGEGGYKVTVDEGSLPCYEMQAMALIVIALKMLFVLDGKYEMEHSEIMTKVNILLGGSKLFVWNDWKRQSMLKEYIFMKSGCSFHDLALDSSLKD